MVGGRGVAASHTYTSTTRAGAFEMICLHTFSERSLTISSTSSSELADARAAIIFAALFTCRIKEESNPHYISTHDVDLNITTIELQRSTYHSSAGDWSANKCIACRDGRTSHDESRSAHASDGLNCHFR